MSDLTLTPFDWVPEMPRGYVRDLRVRWALEEAGLPYRVASTSFSERKPEHFAHQPFGQVPWLSDGDISIFESGAILLHLGELSSKLMPTEPRGRSDVKEWLFAALASVEAASQPWSFFKFSGDTDESPMRKFFDSFLEARLKHMENVLEGCEWLTGVFSIADILNFGWIWRKEFAGVDFSASSNVARWYEKLESRASVKRAIEKLTG